MPVAARSGSPEQVATGLQQRRLLLHVIHAFGIHPLATGMAEGDGALRLCCMSGRVSRVMIAMSA